MKIELKTEPDKSTLEEMDAGVWAVDDRKYIWYKTDSDTFIRMGPCKENYTVSINVCNRKDSYKEYLEGTEVRLLPRGSKIIMTIEK